jgi:hypothetical protein
MNKSTHYQSDSYLELGHQRYPAFMGDASASTLHIASVGLIVERLLPGTVSMLVPILFDKGRSFEYRYSVRCRTMLRVRADRVDHTL